MAKHGFGIIGCGMIADFHAKAIAEIPDAQLVAAFSRSAENGARVAALSVGECRVYDDLDAMLAHPGLDIVCVCTPSGAHLDPAVKAASAGKHVVVEKPLEVTVPRCDAIIRSCDDSGVRLCAIFPSRFSTANMALKLAIDSGRFGRLTLGDTYVKWWRTQDYYDSGKWRGTWDLDGGGALMNQAIHNVDLLQWLMGDVDSVQALTALLVHERIEVEDTAVAALRFKNGALGVIEASTGAFPGLLKRTEIHGENGSARVEQDDVTLWNFRDELPGDSEMLKVQGAFSGGGADPKAIGHAGHRDQLADFVRAINTGSLALVDGREGRKAVEIIRAIYRSSRLGIAVKLPLEDSEGTGPA
jgi:UDP-N-acetyl-2-amino-2-deoxyglucuronate dehydrogenase